MLLRCGGTVNTIANMSMNTPTYSYAYKYAVFDGLRKAASSRQTVGAHPGKEGEIQ
jgi:NAD(P) transhydrogenase